MSIAWSKIKYTLYILLIVFNIPYYSCIALAEKTNLPQIIIKVDKNSAYIGEVIKLNIRVTSDKDIELELPEFKEKIDELNIKSKDETKKISFGKKIISRFYKLESFEPKEYAILPIIIKYKKKTDKDWQTIETEKIKITIKSLLPKQEGSSAGEAALPQIKDIKGPIIPYERVGVLFIIFLILSVISWIIIQKIKAIKEILNPPKPPVPAHIIALQKIKELIGKDLPGRGLIKEFYFELSSIIRKYLEDRFSVKAPEMTTEEFLLYLKDSQNLSGIHKNLLKEFLSDCDMVKFAKYAPNSEEIYKVLDSAKKLIEETKEIPEGKISSTK